VSSSYPDGLAAAAQLIGHAAQLARAMGDAAAEADASRREGDAAAALGVTHLSPVGHPGDDGAAGGGGDVLRFSYTDLVQSLIQVATGFALQSCSVVRVMAMEERTYERTPCKDLHMLLER